jgi:hypothetical protein
MKPSIFNALFIIYLVLKENKKFLEKRIPKSLTKYTKNYNPKTSSIVVVRN